MLGYSNYALAHKQMYNVGPIIGFWSYKISLMPLPHANPGCGVIYLMPSHHVHTGLSSFVFPNLQKQLPKNGEQDALQPIRNDSSLESAAK